MQPTWLDSSQFKENKFYRLLFSFLFFTMNIQWEIKKGQSIWNRSSPFLSIISRPSQEASASPTICNRARPILLTVVPFKPPLSWSQPSDYSLCFSKSSHEGEQNEEKTGENWLFEIFIRVNHPFPPCPSILELILSDYLKDGASVWTLVCHSVLHNNW